MGVDEKNLQHMEDVEMMIMENCPITIHSYGTYIYK